MARRLHVNVVGAVGALCVTALLVAAPAPESPVADAAMRGDTEQVRALLRQGADVNAAQGDGMTALHWATELGVVEMAEVLDPRWGEPGGDDQERRLHAFASG